MVAETYYIKTERIENINFDITIHFCEIRCSLTEIACMKKKNISFSVRSPYAVNQGGLFYGPSSSDILSRTLRIYMAVRIVHMKDCQILCMNLYRQQQCGCCNKYSSHFFLLLSPLTTTLPSVLYPISLPAAVSA